MNDGNTHANPGSTHVNLRHAIQNLDALPAMPVVAQKLLALQMDTEEGERKMLILIEQDPLISAKIIGLANSAAIASSRTITTIRDAVLLLGTTRVKSISTGIAIMSLMTKAPGGRLNAQDLWLHSFGIAFAMLGIARFMPANIRPQDDQIFFVGMLHDIGYLALAFLDPKRSDKLHIHLAEEANRPALEIEREMLEICHDELGSELVRHWSLPEEIVAVVRYHHTPNAADAATAQPFAHMISLAEKLLPSFGISECVIPGIGAEDWNALGIDPDNADEVREQVTEQAEQALQFASTF